MIKHATTLTVVGFVLLFLGVVSLFLNLVGVDIFFLTWLYTIGPLFSFVVRLLMVVLGFVLIVVAKTDWEREEA